MASNSTTEAKGPTPEKQQQEWVELVHTDGTVDLVDARAIGGDVGDLARG